MAQNNTNLTPEQLNAISAYNELNDKLDNLERDVAERIFDCDNMIKGFSDFLEDKMVDLYDKATNVDTNNKEDVAELKETYKEVYGAVSAARDLNYLKNEYSGIENKYEIAQGLMNEKLEGVEKEKYIDFIDNIKNTEKETNDITNVDFSHAFHKEVFFSSTLNSVSDTISDKIERYNATVDNEKDKLNVEIVDKTMEINGMEVTVPETVVTNFYGVKADISEDKLDDDIREAVDIDVPAILTENVLDIEKIPDVIRYDPNGMGQKINEMMERYEQGERIGKDDADTIISYVKEVNHYGFEKYEQFLKDEKAEKVERIDNDGKISLGDVKIKEVPSASLQMIDNIIKDKGISVEEEKRVYDDTYDKVEKLDITTFDKDKIENKNNDIEKNENEPVDKGVIGTIRDVLGRQNRRDFNPQGEITINGKEVKKTEWVDKKDENGNVVKDKLGNVVKEEVDTPVFQAIKEALGKYQAIEEHQGDMSRKYGRHAFQMTSNSICEMQKTKIKTELGKMGVDFGEGKIFLSKSTTSLQVLNGIHFLKTNPLVEIELRIISAIVDMVSEVFSGNSVDKGIEKYLIDKENPALAAEDLKKDDSVNNVTTDENKPEEVDNKNLENDIKDVETKEEDNIDNEKEDEVEVNSDEIKDIENEEDQLEKENENKIDVDDKDNTETKEEDKNEDKDVEKEDKEDKLENTEEAVDNDTDKNMSEFAKDVDEEDLKDLSDGDLSYFNSDGPDDISEGVENPVPDLENVTDDNENDVENPQNDDAAIVDEEDDIEDDSIETQEEVSETENDPASEAADEIDKTEEKMDESLQDFKEKEDEIDTGGQEEALKDTIEEADEQEKDKFENEDNNTVQDTENEDNNTVQDTENEEKNDVENENLGPEIEAKEPTTDIMGVETDKDGQVYDAFGNPVDIDIDSIDKNFNDNMSDLEIGERNDAMGIDKNDYLYASGNDTDSEQTRHFDFRDDDALQELADSLQDRFDLSDDQKDSLVDMVNANDGMIDVTLPESDWQNDVDLGKELLDMFL